MLKKSNQLNKRVNLLYNNILLLSRNKVFYTNFALSDTFHNRIHLIFIHISFLFIKLKQDMKKDKYKLFFQDLFDLTFNSIEINMRELGYGDVSINNKMKLLVKSFYSVLIFCENYDIKEKKSKDKFFSNYLEKNINKKEPNNMPIIRYFDKYKSFCFDLPPDSVLKGDLNFNCR